MDVEEIRREVEDAGRRHYAAAMAGDAEACAELLAEELVYTHSNGLTDYGKAAYLHDHVASGNYVAMGMTVDHSVDRIVVLRDDVAMVKGKQISNTTGGEGRFKMEGQEAGSLDIWVKREGRWQLLAHHMTLVRSPDAWRKAFEASHPPTP
jgi:uncharacterized protein (TIGR02246 family)